MGKLNLQETVLPLLLKRGEERRGEKRRKQRVQTIFELQKIMQNPNSTLDEKMQAGAELGSYGQNVPQSAYKQKTDWESIYTRFKVEPTLQELHRTGALEDEALTRMLVKRLDSSTLKTKEDVQFMLDNIPELEDMDPDQMLALIRHKEYLGADATNKLVGGEGGKQSVLEEKFAHIDKIMGGRGFDALGPSDRAKLKVLSVGEKELKAAYDLSGDDEEASEILKLRRQMAAEYAKTKMMMWAIQGIDPSPGERKQLEEAVTSFLEGEKLFDYQQTIVDFIKKNRKGQSREQIRQYLENERPRGLMDIDIQMIMRAL